MEILSKINSSVLVKINADSPSSANTLFEALNNRGKQERFFRHSYNAFRTAWKSDFPVGKRANLYESYDKMIVFNSLRVFEQIRECAKIYPRFQGKEATRLSTSLHEAYKDLGRINGATSYTLLLYLGSIEHIMRKRYQWNGKKC